MASLPSNILSQSISFTLRSDHGDGEGDGDCAANAKNGETRKGNKGDCISIAKKIALMDEFNALKDKGCIKPNQEPHLYIYIYI